MVFHHPTQDAQHHPLWTSSTRPRKTGITARMVTTFGQTMRELNAGIWRLDEFRDEMEGEVGETARGGGEGVVEKPGGES